MSELNKKLETYRDNNYNSPNYNYVKEVLNQLLVIGFNNQDNPDELPNEFTIKAVHLCKANFESLMLDIGVRVEVQEKFVDFYNRLHTYVVNLI